MNVVDEYNLCHKVERKWYKLFKTNCFYCPQEAKNFCNKICGKLGYWKINNVKFQRKGIKCGIEAYYDNFNIYTPFENIYIDVLIHELTHHFGELGHGKSFCKRENFLFSVAYKLLENYE